MIIVQRPLLSSIEMGAESGIEEFILEKELQLRIYHNSTQNEERRLQNIEAAIENLENALPGVRHALEIQKQNLEVFSAMRARISSMDSVFSSPLKDEKTSMKLCENLQYILSKQTRVWVRLTDTLVKFSQNRLSEIDQTSRRLEAELRSWTFSRDVHQESLTRSRDMLKEIQKELYIAKGTFQKIPAEVWVDIFWWRTQRDLDEFYTTHNRRPFQPAAMILSAVCRSWRDIITQESDLWRHIAVHPCASWSNNKIELFEFSLGMARRQKTLISNLSQSLMWNNNSYYYGYRGQLRSIDANIIIGDYAITLVTSEDDTTTMSRINSLPFCNPSKLTLVNRSGSQYGHLFSYIQSFTTVKSLEVVDPTPCSFDSWQLSSRFPNLTQLSIEAEVYEYTFNPHLSFVPTLQTLRIRHSGQNHFPTMQNAVRLPHLTTLEVTPPSTSLFQVADAQYLQQLILCGPKRTATVAPTSPAGNSKIRLQPVRYLEFRSWLPPGLISGVRSCDVVATFLDWVKQMPQVRKLKFVDSHVDGRRLLNLLRSWRVLEDSTGPQQWEITFDCCTGITRYECDELKRLVEKINVLV
ncbi:hypothetical protein FRC19_007709 [Serendipita sp. 401]|nr:hypothetical protein FRC19_007709 [Serendipita sp. 401]KAG9044086.1 hypothetical protein FS842_001594 [Serendipita sp. 407]